MGGLYTFARPRDRRAGKLPLVPDRRPPPLLLMNRGVPRETDRRERRVALVPQTVRRLVAAGHGVVLERWAGADASFTDEEYTAAGARIVESRAALLGGADAILSVQR